MYKRQTKASPKTHRTTIVHALKSVRSGIVFEELSKQRELANYVRTVIDTIEVNKVAGNPWGKFPLPKNFHQSVEKWETGIVSDEDFSADLNNAIQAFKNQVADLINARREKYAHFDYTRDEVDRLISLLKDIYAKAGGKAVSYTHLDVYKRQTSNFTSECK